MNRHMTLFGSGVLIVCLSACTNTSRNTLGKLKYEAEEEAPIVFEKLDHQQVREEYKELLDVFEDDKLKEQIERRIADVYMLEGDYDLRSNAQQSNYYIDAIKAYRNILERFPNSPDNAEVLYQLAKAYDMEGQQNEAKTMLLELTTLHPNYSHIGEAYFRLGDIYFGEENYKEASSSYMAVTQSSNEKLHLNAHYMLGWTKYKLTQYRSSVDSFSLVLGQYMLTNDELSFLSKGDKTIVDNTLHALNLALDKIGGAGSITSFPELMGKPYTWLVFQKLGNYYFDKALYEQSADTYRQFLDANPLAKRAPVFHRNIINTYTEGHFPKLALAEKNKYVSNFGIHSSYFSNPGVDQETLADLKVFLDELARHHYSLGSEATKRLEALTALDKPKPEALKKAGDRQTKEFSRAANFYGEYLDTFPEDSRFDEIVYLQAEALFISRQFDDAARGYEHVAYTPKGRQSVEGYAADAGYAAILSYQKLVDKTKGKEPELHTQWQIKAVESMFKFSEFYHADERSPSVLTNAAEYLFSLNQYQRAIDIGNQLIASNVSLDEKLKKTALGIVAHSYFKIDDFLNAKKSYIRQRELTLVDGEEHKAISERLASATYKYAKQKLAENETDIAISELLDIKQLTPESPVRPIAQYDAATLLIEQSRWTEAVDELKELIALYPKHQLAPEFPRKLAYAYRANKDWLLAADAYLNLHHHDKNEEMRREALFIAAEMFEQNMSYDTAITHYKSYAYAYEKPFDMRMEARYKLAINYVRIHEEGKSLYWLRRIIDGHAEAGSEQSDRSRWLAGWAHMQYGDSFAKAFREHRLALPLVKSLVKKKTAMESAIGHYEKAVDFGILEFVTMSSYKIAGLYSVLAEDLSASPRPKGLSEGDVQIYNQAISQQVEPLNRLAIDLHLSNAERAWQGEYNTWIEASFDQLRLLAPNRFAKQEQLVSYGNEIR